MIDSGCTEHITPFITDFTTYTTLRCPESVRLTNQSTTCAIIGKGEVRGHTIVNGNQIETVLQDVLHVPGIRKRFISTWHLDQRGFSVTHCNSKVTIMHLATDQICGIGELKEDNEYYLPVTLSAPP